MNIGKSILFSGAALAALMSQGSAFAQDSQQTEGVGSDRTLEDIVVTARRSSERLQDTPLAVTAISSEQLATTGVFSPERLGQIAPGLHVTVSTLNRDTVVLNIRGQSPEYNTIFPSVVPYLAEVPLESLTRGQFYDLESLQVLRGPQGVRFGRVTNGGALLLQPRRPGNEFAGNIEVRGGTYNLRAISGGVTVPLATDVFSIRAAVNVIRRDGYTRNLVTGRDLDNENSQSFRIGALFTPADWFENYTIYQYSRINTNGSGSSIDQLQLDSILQPSLQSIGNVFAPQGGAAFAAETIAALQANFARQQARGPRITEIGSLAYGPDGGIRSYRRSDLWINTTTIRPAENIQIKNIFGYQKYLTQDGADIDGTGVVLIDSPNHLAPNLDGEQFSNELQINGKFGIFNVTVGAYGDVQQRTGPQENSYIVQLGGLQRASILLPRTKSRAIYTNGEIDLSSVAEGLKINGGIRYTHDTVRARSGVYDYFAQPSVSPRDPNRPVGECVNYRTTTCLSLSAESKATTYEFGASYDLGRIFFYAAYKKGYRPGGVNTTVDPTKLVYLPEGNTEIEIGAKTDFTVGGVPMRFNIAAYYDDYTAIQKAVTTQVGNASTTNITNIADGIVKGFEFEFRAEPLDGLTLGVSGAYTDAKYKQGTQDLFGPTGACNRGSFRIFGFCTLSPFLATPETTVTVDVAYKLPLDESIGRLTVGGEFYYQSSISLSPRAYVVPSAIEPGYSLINLNFSWERIAGSPFDLRVFATNVTNKIYRISSGSLNYRASLGTSSSLYGEPRMVGASLRYNFGADVK